MIELFEVAIENRFINLQTSLVDFKADFLWYCLRPMVLIEQQLELIRIKLSSIGWTLSLDYWLWFLMLALLKWTRLS